MPGRPLILPFPAQALNPESRKNVAQTLQDGIFQNEISVKFGKFFKLTANLCAFDGKG